MTYSIRPSRGFFVYNPPQDIAKEENLFIEFKPNDPSGDMLVMSPTMTTPLHCYFYFPQSYPRSHVLQFSPPTQHHILFGVNDVKRSITYTYQTDDVIGGVERVVNRTVEMMFQPNDVDPTKLELTLLADIDIYSFTSWKPRSISTIDKTKYGGSLEVLPHSFFSGQLNIHQCLATSTSTCSLVRYQTISIQYAIEVDFDLTPELDAPYSSILRLSRDLSSSDTITLILPANIALTSTAQRFNAAGYSALVTQNNPTYGDKTTITIECHKYFTAHYEFRVPTQLNATASQLDADGAASGDVEVHLDMFNVLTQTTKHYQVILPNITIHNIRRPILALEFPNGFNFNQDVAFVLTLGRELRFGQRVFLYDLPLAVHKTLYFTTTNLQFELSSEHRSTFFSLLEVTSRNLHTIPPGTPIEFTFPSYIFTPAFSSVHFDLIANNLPIKANATGFGARSEELVAFDIATHALVGGVDLMAYWSLFVPTFYPPVTTEDSASTTPRQLPCHVGVVCNVGFDLLNIATQPYPLDNLVYFDIIISFNHLSTAQDGRGYHVELDTAFIAARNNITTTSTNGAFVYTMLYTSDTITIRTMRSPGATHAAFTLLSFDVVFAKSTPSGVMDVKIVKYGDATYQHGATIHRSTTAIGPTVVGSDTFTPHWFYVKGGVFVDETLELGVHPAVALTAHPQNLPNTPTPSTIVFRFQPTQAIDGYDTMVWPAQTYQQVSSPWKLKRQTTTPLQSVDALGYLEITESEGFVLVITQTAVTSAAEYFVIRAPDNSPYSSKFDYPVNLLTPFNVTAYSQPFDLTKVDPTATPLDIAKQFTQQDVYAEASAPGWVVRRKPWVRVKPTWFSLTNPDLVLDTIPIGIAGNVVLDITFQIYMANLPFGPTTHTFLPQDDVVFALPAFYSTPVGTYECTCIDDQLQDDCGAIPLLHNGHHFRFGFATLAAVPTRIQCTFPLSVEQVDVDVWLAEKQQTRLTAESTLSFVDFRVHGLDGVVELGADGDLVVPQVNASHIPSVGTTDPITNSHHPITSLTGVPTTVREEFLSFSMLFPVQQPRVEIDYQVSLVNSPGTMTITMMHTTISHVLLSTIEWTAPFELVTGSAECRDVAGDVVVGRLFTLFGCPKNTGCLQLEIINAPILIDKIVCTATITPTSGYAHHFQPLTQSVTLSGSVGRTKFTTAQLATVNFLPTATPSVYETLRVARPVITLSGSFIETLTTTLNIRGSELSLTATDDIIVSLGFPFKPAHSDWSNTYCLVPSNGAAALVIFNHYGTPFQNDFAPDETNFARDTNPENAEQIATGFTIRFLISGSTGVTALESWSCRFDITPAVGILTSKRSPHVYQKRSVVNDKNVVEHISIPIAVEHTDMRVDALAEVDLGLIADQVGAATESMIILYYNSTLIRTNRASSPVLFLTLPSIFTSNPDTYGVICASSDPLIGRVTLPLQKLFLSSVSSLYTIPLDRFILRTQKELSSVRCTFPKLASNGQLPMIDGKLELGTSTIFSTITVPLNRIASHSIIANGQPFTSFPQYGYDMRDLALHDHHLAWDNSRPTTITHVINNLRANDVVDFAFSSDFTPTQSTRCMTREGRVLTDVYNGQHLLTRQIPEVAECNVTFTPLFRNFSPLLLDSRWGPLGCGVAPQNWSVGDQPTVPYCTLPSWSTYQVGEAFFTYPTAITFKPAIHITSSTSIDYPDRPYFLYEAYSYRASFTGFYPNSTVTIQLNNTIASLTFTMMTFIDNQRNTVQSCPQVPGAQHATYRCTIHPKAGGNVTFYNTQELQFIWQFAGMTTVPLSDALLFTTTFEQAPYMDVPDDERTIVVPFIVDLRRLQAITPRHVLNLVAGRSEPHYQVLAVTGTRRPVLSLQYPTYIDPITKQRAPIPAGLTSEFKFAMTLMPNMFDFLTIPLGIAQETNTTLISQTQRVTPFSVFSTPRGNVSLTRGADGNTTNTLDTFCYFDIPQTTMSASFGRSTFSRLDLFKVSIVVLPRDDVVDPLEPQQHPVVAKMYPIFENIRKFRSYQFDNDLYDGHLECIFPLTLLRANDVVLLPPTAVLKKVVVATTDQTYHDVITPNLQDNVQAQCILTFSPSFNPTVLGYTAFPCLVAFGHYARAFASNTTVGASVDSKALTLGVPGYVTLSVDRLVIDQGDVILLALKPRHLFPQTLKNIDLTNATTTYTGNGGLVDQLIDGGIDYTSILQQKYKLLTPQFYSSDDLSAAYHNLEGLTPEMLSGGSLCYNTLYPTTDNEPVGLLMPVDGSSYRELSGGSSDTFILRVLIAPKKRGVGYTLSNLRCQASFIALQQHLFHGELNVVYLTKNEYDLLTEAPTEAPTNTHTPAPPPSGDEISSGNALVRSDMTLEERKNAVTLELANNKIIDLRSGISPGLDVRTTISTVPMPVDNKQAIALNLILSASPPQDNVFVAINTTNVGFAAFYACSGDHMLADFYPSNGGVTNTVHDGVIRIFFQRVTDQTVASCYFMPPIIQPLAYLEINPMTENDTMPILKYTPETIPPLEISTKVYKLINPQFAQNSPYIDAAQIPLIKSLSAPSTLQELRALHYFDLTPLATYSMPYYGQLQEPIIPASLTFSLANRPPANPYLTAQERQSFLSTLVSTLAIHVVQGIFQPLEAADLYMTRENFDIRTRLLIITFAYLSPSMLQTYTKDFSRSAADVTHFDNFSAVLSAIHHETVYEWQTTVLQTTGLNIVLPEGINNTNHNQAFIPIPISTTSTGRGTIKKAFRFSPYVEYQPTFLSCLSPSPASQCNTKLEEGMPCYRASQCRSENCEIELDDSFSSRSARNPISVQFGVTAPVGVCREHIIVASQRSAFSRHGELQQQTALVAAYEAALAREKTKQSSQNTIAAIIRTVALTAPEDDYTQTVVRFYITEVGQHLSLHSNENGDDQEGDVDLLTAASMGNTPTPQCTIVVTFIIVLSLMLL